MRISAGACSRAVGQGRSAAPWALKLPAGRWPRILPVLKARTGPIRGQYLAHRVHDPQLVYGDGKLSDRPNRDHLISRSPVVLPPGCKLGRHPKVEADRVIAALAVAEQHVARVHSWVACPRCRLPSPALSLRARVCQAASGMSGLAAPSRCSAKYLVSAVPGAHAMLVEVDVRQSLDSGLRRCGGWAGPRRSLGPG